MTLIAVIGAVEPALVNAWTAHYRALGVEHFCIAVHLAPGTPTEREERFLDAAGACGLPIRFFERGPWHEHVNTALTRRLRSAAGCGWHLLADSDEFQAWTVPPERAAGLAQARGDVYVPGMLLDRVSATGELIDIDPARGFDEAYPLGGLMTHTLLRGDPRKVVLVRDDVPVASGNHRIPGDPPGDRVPVPVHHFKWRGPVLEDLRRRIERFASGTWQAATPAVHDEATRMIRHLDAHDGRIDVSDPAVALRPVSLTATPAWWQGETLAVQQSWRPPTASQGPHPSG